MGRGGWCVWGGERTVTCSLFPPPMTSTWEGLPPAAIQAIAAAALPYRGVGNAMARVCHLWRQALGPRRSWLTDMVLECDEHLLRAEWPWIEKNLSREALSTLWHLATTERQSSFGALAFTIVFYCHIYRAGRPLNHCPQCHPPNHTIEIPAGTYYCTTAGCHTSPIRVCDFTLCTALVCPFSEPVAG